ncbi:dihydrolipoamide dehydrogenase [Neobacillus niacini]|jgi:dihydrolipoamide dehydrogenase|uniref:dihydrolipoyl dehydrogenase n=1 Tax=Neobacillus niacini TaxID=86668 RepID=UPI002780E3D4|nr:dihydrolipoyl dehydrogenase [Neobacillus niacini]MDQ1002913.1 dihydrolipoamide dehydrogenase [Neobacillus niacini]
MVVGDFLYQTEVLVIGGGPGGYTAAIRAAQLGKEVTLVEKKALGGVCLNEGCIPSKALIAQADQFYKLKKLADRGIEVQKASLNFRKFQKWKRTDVVSKLANGVAALCNKNKVNVIYGEAVITDHQEVRIMTEHGSQRYHFQQCILATGSCPLELPMLPFGERILSSSEALELTEIPKQLIIVGGGYIGIEMGTAFAKLGSKVTILEAAPNILPSFEKSMVELIKRNLKRLGVTIHTKSVVRQSEATDDGVNITIQIGDKEEVISADYCLVTIGRTPNTRQLGLETIGITLTDTGLIETDQQCKTNVQNIFAIGDITQGSALAHKAAYEGKVAAEVIAGIDRVIDYVAMPSVIFSDPEIACVGLTEQQAKEQGYEVKVGKFPFSINGKALSSDETEGYVKIIADQDERVIGVQMIGSQASNLIGEAALAIEMGAKVEDICLTIHPHPTLTEGLLEASEALLKKAIHLVNF